METMLVMVSIILSGGVGLALGAILGFSARKATS